MTHHQMNTNHGDAPALDLFSLIESEARAVAAAFGVNTADEIAAALVDRLQHQVQGDRIYIAKRSKTRRQEAHEAMKREFNGLNMREVAVRYGYSPSQARRILQKR